MTQPIRNPVDLQPLLSEGRLLPAEERLSDYLRRGQREGVRCVVEAEGIPDKPPKPPDKRIESGPFANVVRAEVIRFFAYGGSDERPVLGTFIRLQGAWVCGELDLTHAVIPYALVFHNCRFNGPVIMRHAECAELDLKGSCLEKGLEGDPLWTKGSVELGGGLVAKGEVKLPSARIGGVLDCDGGEFCGGLIANKAKIGVLVWLNVKGKGEVQLKAAKADVLDDDLDSWKSFKVDLDGFTYDQIVGPTDAESRIKWLTNLKHFSPLPYEQAAKVLRGMGKDIDAWDIEREKRRLERAERDANNTPKVPSWRRLWGRTIDTLTDFVYRPWKTLGWAVSIVLAGALLFDCADENGRMVPHQPAALASVKYQYGRIPSETPGETVARKFPGYPEFNPLLFSADIFVPLLNLHQEPFWYPAPDGGRPSWWRAPKDEGVSLWFLLEWWYWFQIAAGAVLTSMFLLSVTGLLRPRQSSGEKG